MVKHPLKFYINGKWVDPETPNAIDVINPATEEPMGQISFGGEADVNKAVAAAKAAFASYSQTSREQRMGYLEKILVCYKDRWQDIAEAISREMGAPMQLASGPQTDYGYTFFADALAALKDYEFERKMGNTQISEEPIGVCGLITPWNWPMVQVANKVAPALACGCTMVLKPSEFAPYDAMILAEIMEEVGLPKGVFNLVNGDGPTVGEAMSSHPDVAMMSITGSTRAGSAVARTSAATVKRVVQELGGKSPNVILDDADLERVVARDVTEMMKNSGQSCNAPTRMLVPAGKLAEVEAVAKRTAESLSIGDPADGGAFMGPVVSKQQWDKVQRLITQGIEEGCELLTGGTGKPEGLETGYYIKPTIFTNVTNDKAIAREEIFGPVLAIMTYESIEEAVEIANDTDYGLSAYVSSSRLDRANEVAKQLRAGNVHIDGQWGTVRTPFGGFKQSGNGREGGVFGFPDYLELKAVMGFYSES